MATKKKQAKRPTENKKEPSMPDASAAGTTLAGMITGLNPNCPAPYQPTLTKRQQVAKELDDKIREAKYLTDDIEGLNRRVTNAKVYLAELQGQIAVLRYKVAE